MQEGYLHKLLDKPTLNYVALNRAAAHDPYAFINAPCVSAVSMDSEAILPTALSRVPPPTLLQATTLPEAEAPGGTLPDFMSGTSLLSARPKSAPVTPHMSYSVAKLLEQKEHVVSEPTKLLDVRSRTYGNPGCGGSPTALCASACPQCSLSSAYHVHSLESCYAVLCFRRRCLSAPPSERNTHGTSAASMP